MTDDRDSGGLFHFEWGVDQHGYELVEPPKPRPGERTGALLLKGDPGPSIRRKGGPLRMYRPLEDEPGLFRRFAETPRGPDAVLEFVGEFGLLGSAWGAVEDHTKEPFDGWFQSIRLMQRIVRALDVDQGPDARDLFNEFVQPRLSMRIENGRGKRPQIKIVPRTLYGAMWIQVAGELTDGTKFRQCKVCPNWFPYGPGTGHRDRKVFCSDRCRTAWNRRKRKAAREQ